MTDSERPRPQSRGPAWSAGAAGWVDHWARFAAAAREAVVRAAGIKAGASVLDVACGSGEFCELAAARGAQVSGIDEPWVAICNWGRIEDRQVHAIFAPLREVEPPPPQDTSPYDPPPIGEPGVLEDLARREGLAPERADEVEVPYEFPDFPTLERTLLDFAPILRIGPEVAERVVRTTVEADAEPFRRSDGSYRFENRFRCLIAVVP